MTTYSYDRTAATRRQQLERDLAEARAKIKYIQTLDRPADVTALAIKRWQTDILRLEAALAKLAPVKPEAPTVKKPKAVSWKFTSQPASEDCECLECGLLIAAGRREWWAEAPDGSMGPFCTRGHAQSLAALNRGTGGDQ